MSVVLVIDDSPIDRVLAGGLLTKQAGCQVIYADDGEAGLKSSREVAPDLIVTDMQMPALNGLQLVESLRQAGIQIPVILMTAVGSEELAVEALRLGASSYVPKRSLAKRLADTVRMVLAAAEKEREEHQLMHRCRTHHESFELDNRLEECRAMSRHLQSQLGKLWELDQTTRLQIGLAVEEALLNALYHGNLEVDSSLKELPDNKFFEVALQRQTELPYSERRIHVGSSITPEECRITVRDCGPGFDVTKLPDPTDPANLTRPYGRGLMLMQTFMDDVRFSERGNEVTLLKRNSNFR